MFKLRVEDNFAAAHYIKNYHGKCENLHGHNYRVRVFVTGHELDNGGMLIDFGILKKNLKEVLKQLDHTNLNDIPLFNEKDPSAELISFFIYKELKKLLPDANISEVQVFETNINMASYIPE
jgi:6-pyruvoyltetrahydropterin/6-carboxytetrahydropterin synthase